MIVGHNTFATLPSLLPGRLHIVLTTQPEGKTNIPGQLEYTNQSPDAILADLEGRGYTQAVVAGGGQVLDIGFFVGTETSGQCGKT